MRLSLPWNWKQRSPRWQKQSVPCLGLRDLAGYRLWGMLESRTLTGKLYIRSPRFPLKSQLGTGGAAQRLLSVTCDASVRLTHDLKIKTPSRSLLDLLMCNFGSNCTTQLEGMAFLRYVAQGEHERFMKFIDENSQSTSPARSLPIDLKDSSGVTFKAELFHVTVPSLSGDGEHEHLIGITNDLADDRLGRMEHTLEDLPVASSQGLPMISEVDSRYQGTGALSHSFAPSQRHSCGKSSVSSSNSSKSSRAQLSTMREISEMDLVIDLETVDKDFRILSITLHFATPTSCAENALPNLVEWLKPRYRQQVHNWIQEHANAHYAGREYREPLRGIKLSLSLTEDVSVLFQLVPCAFCQPKPKLETVGFLK